jgi:hypothetical protein
VQTDARISKVHKLERQFKCKYCSPCFKAKNEANRHENSLHIRGETWKCVAINDFTKISQNSTERASRPDTQVSLVDICSFCGEDFPSQPSPDWSLRDYHLTSVHKIDGRDKHRSFHRVDHYLQYVVHFHEGQRGPWLTELEELAWWEDNQAGDKEGDSSTTATTKFI